MVDFTLHTPDTTEGERKEVLETAQKNYGFVPNLLAGLSEAPAAARAYMNVGKEVGASSFTPEQRHVAWFAVNHYNDCHYCMPAHSAIATMEKIDAGVIESARKGGGYADAKLQALHDFMIDLVDQRGNVDDASVNKFLAAGYTKQNVLEGVLVIAHKTISNYANHLMQTPVDDSFASFAWKKTA